MTTEDPPFTHEGLQYTRVQCPVCGMLYCIPYCVDEHLKKSPLLYAYCPNGHVWHYEAIVKVPETKAFFSLKNLKLVPLKNPPGAANAR